MIRSKAFFKRTRRGKVMRILEEHYLRDDVGLGTLHGASSSPLTPSELQLLLEERASGRGGQREGGKEGGRPVLGILDTNVALEQLDFLENAQLTFQEEKEAAEAAQEGKVQGEGEGGENDTPSNYESLIPSPVVQPPASSSSSSSTVKPTGRVVGVIKRNWRVYCGSLQASADKVGGGGGGSTVSALFVPVDRRLPKVRLQTRQREALQDKRILVAVDAWPATSRFPIGHYVKTLGAVGDKEVETEVLLHEYDIPWEPFSEKADIVAVDFCRSIIRSVAALSYQEAQNIHDDPRRKDAVATGIRYLNSLAKQLRSKRMEAGALLLASTEVKFVLDAESADPLDVQMYQLKETHALVEEFMLLANITVGKKILRHYPTLSLLRRHPSPSRERFEPLIAAAASRGFTLCVDDSRALQQSLDASTDKDDPYINRIVRILATRCMFPAQYFCSGEYPQGEWHHYGLAAPIYTHFTSPIRRYADIVVHRLLAAAIGVAPLPEALMDKGNLHDLSENMNRRHKAAQNAGRGSTAFHTVLFFKENPAEAEDAYILRILETRLIVLVPRFGIEGSIDLKPLADHGLLNRDADGHRITCPGNIKLRVFDKVQVGIRVAEGQAAHRDAVLYTLKRPLIPGLEEAAVGGGGKKTGVGAALGKRKGGGSK
ncbi:exosome complex exonuclease [Nannochloropsis oceanica]